MVSAVYRGVTIPRSKRFGLTVVVWESKLVFGAEWESPRAAMLGGGGCGNRSYIRERPSTAFC